MTIMKDDLVSRNKCIETIAKHLGVPAQVWIGKATKWLQEVPAECGHCKDCDHYSEYSFNGQIRGVGLCDEVQAFKKETGFCDLFEPIE